MHTFGQQSARKPVQWKFWTSTTSSTNHKTVLKFEIADKIKFWRKVILDLRKMETKLAFKKWVWNMHTASYNSMHMIHLFEFTLAFIKWKLMSAVASLEWFGEKEPFFKKWRSCKHCLQSRPVVPGFARFWQIS